MALAAPSSSRALSHDCVTWSRFSACAAERGRGIAKLRPQRRRALCPTPDQKEKEEGRAQRTARTDSGCPLVVDPVTDTTMIVALGSTPSRFTNVMSCR